MRLSSCAFIVFLLSITCGRSANIEAIATTVEARPPAPRLPPNIVVVLTDDQDETTLSVETSMPQTKRLLLDQGVRFLRAFANTPVCCPSRATLLTGRYPHSPGMTKSNRANCGGKDWRNGPELDSIAVRMQEHGYKTMYAGKYLNSYGMGDPSPSQVPPGWSEWFALVGNSKYWNYSVSDEGVEQRFGSISGAGDYFTDTLARRAVKFVKSASLPFFLWVSPPAAHAPFSPAIRHVGTWSKMRVPRTAAFNSSGLGKHDPVGTAKPLTKENADECAEIFRARGESLQSVDELVVSLVAALRDRNVDNSTFVIFTSDNAFHLGDFRLGFDKRQPYDTDIRVPLIITGPGVEKRGNRNAFVSHVDLAPTILDLAGAEAQPDWDGQSFKSVLFGVESKSKHNLVLIEYEGEADPLTNGALFCGAGKVAYDDLSRARNAGQYRPAVCDSWNNTYTCLRGSDSSFVGHEFLFCQFECFAIVRGPGARRGVKTKVPCQKNSPNALGEFYDLSKDPHQLENKVHELTWMDKLRLLRKLATMKTCRGALGCMRHDEDENNNDDVRTKYATGGVVLSALQ